MFFLKSRLGNLSRLRSLSYSLSYSHGYVTPDVTYWILIGHLLFTMFIILRDLLEQNKEYFFPKFQLLLLHVTFRSRVTKLVKQGKSSTTYINFFLCDWACFLDERRPLNVYLKGHLQLMHQRSLMWRLFANTVAVSCDLMDELL